jgi:hypothetical protein
MKIFFMTIFGVIRCNQLTDFHNTLKERNFDYKQRTTVLQNLDSQHLVSEAFFVLLAYRSKAAFMQSIVSISHSFFSESRSHRLYNRREDEGREFSHRCAREGLG